jgi:hypothetical protein
MCPHSAQRRRCSHQPPLARHSRQPSPVGSTAGLIPRARPCCFFIPPAAVKSSCADSTLSPRWPSASLVADGLCAHARALALYQLDQVLVLDLVRLLSSVRRRFTILQRRRACSMATLRHKATRWCLVLCFVHGGQRGLADSCHCSRGFIAHAPRIVRIGREEIIGACDLGRVRFAFAADRPCNMGSEPT